MTPYFDQCGVRIFNGDCREVLRALPDASVNCCVTSPPYFGLRDYGHSGQIGLEQSPDDYVAQMVAVFAETRRVLKDDGTLWLNLGDSYCSTPAGCGADGVSRSSTLHGINGISEKYRDTLRRGHGMTRDKSKVPGLKLKDLVGIPWMVAFALRADGWYLRQDIIWSKPNPMPESVTDRCTKAHEYIFLLSKSERYYYDAKAIAEPCTESSIVRLSQDVESQIGSDRVPGKTNGTMKAVGGARKVNGGASFGKQNHSVEGTGAQSRTFDRPIYEKRNRRSVWTVTTKPYSGAHFAVFPADLIEPCIRAGCPDGGTVLDPFFGSGTTGEVCQRQHVNCIGIELNPAYCALAAKRLAQGVLSFAEGA